MEGKRARPNGGRAYGPFGATSGVSHCFWLTHWNPPLRGGTSFSNGPLQDFQTSLLLDLRGQVNRDRRRASGCSERTGLAPGPVVLVLGDSAPRERGQSLKTVLVAAAGEGAPLASSGSRSGRLLTLYTAQDGAPTTQNEGVGRSIMLKSRYPGLHLRRCSSLVASGWSQFLPPRSGGGAGGYRKV